MLRYQSRAKSSQMTYSPILEPNLQASFGHIKLLCQFGPHAAGRMLIDDKEFLQLRELLGGRLVPLLVLSGFESATKKWL